jgi:hypothetical protein
MRTGLRRLTIAVVATLSLLPAADAGAQTPPPERRGGDPDRHAAALTPAEQARLGALPIEAGSTSRRPVTDAQGRVAVVVEGPDDAALGDAVEDAGGVVAGNLAQGVSAYVAPEDLAEVTSSPGVTGAWVDQAPIPMDVSEGVDDRFNTLGATNADLWHTDTPARLGTGVKIGIIDVGFHGFNALPTPGDRPPAGQVATPLNLCNPLDMFGTAVDVHGTAVTEIAYDMAPGATFYLVCINQESDLATAVDSYLIPNGVTIVSMSLGFTDGRGDGSFHHVGQAAEVVRRTRLLNGMLWTVSAGNDAQRHYQVNAGDADGDFVAEIFPGRPAAGNQNEFFQFVVGANDTAFLDVRWDSWFGPVRDYDLIVLNTEDGTDVVDSILDQTAGLPPWEFVTIQNDANHNVIYRAEIERFSAPTTPVRFDFFFDGAVGPETFTSAQSITEPATSPYVMAIGAHCVFDTEREDFSSMGPTIDSRIKPDISAPDAVSTQTYGGVTQECASGFFGTSAAAPHTAGAAALLLEANGTLDVAELQAQLEAGAATSDQLPQGLDNGTGFGELTLSHDVDPPTPPTGARYTGINPPARIMDTRVPTGACNPGPCSRLGPAQTRNLDVIGPAGVPDGAVAVILNVTVVNPTATSHLAVFPAPAGPAPVPTIANLNFSAGQVVGNHVTATVGAAELVSFFNAAGSVDVVVDLAGYYTPGGPAGLFPITPGRIMDTRAASCVGPRCIPLGPGQQQTLLVRGVTPVGSTPIPMDATAVVLNVTGVQPTSQTHLTIWPDGSVPTSASLNLAAGAVRGNLVIATIGSDGAIRFFNAAGQTNVVADVLGYFAPGGSAYVPLIPRRTLDTRNGNGRFGALGPDQRFDHQTQLIYSVPDDATAALWNVTVVTPTGAGHLTIFPDGAAEPTTANVNFTAGQIVPNAVISRIGDTTVEMGEPTGQITIFNNNTAPNTTHVIVDLAGYFVGP